MCPATRLRARRKRTGSARKIPAPPTSWPTSTAPAPATGPTEAINGRLEHLRGSALGFRNLTNYIARSLLTAIWHMLVNNIDYHELGPDHFTRREPAHVMRRITKQANALGFTVRFDPLPETAGAS